MSFVVFCHRIPFWVEVGPWNVWNDSIGCSVVKQWEIKVDKHSIVEEFLSFLIKNLNLILWRIFSLNKFIVSTIYWQVSSDENAFFEIISTHNSIIRLFEFLWNGIQKRIWSFLADLQEGSVWKRWVSIQKKNYVKKKRMNKFNIPHLKVINEVSHFYFETFRCFFWSCLKRVSERRNILIWLWKGVSENTKEEDHHFSSCERKKYFSPSSFSYSPLFSSFLRRERGYLALGEWN